MTAVRQNTTTINILVMFTLPAGSKLQCGQSVPGLNCAAGTSGIGDGAADSSLTFPCERVCAESPALFFATNEHVVH